MKTPISHAWKALMPGLFLAFTLSAAPVKEQEAVAAAELWYSMEINSATMALSGVEKEQRLANRGKHQVHYLLGRDDVQTLTRAGTSPLAYVVTFEPTGFVIVSGEDSLQPVLVFNATGEFTWAGPNVNYASYFLGRCVASAVIQLRERAAKGDIEPVHANWTQLRRELQSPNSAKTFWGPEELNGIYVLWPTALWHQWDHYNDTCVAQNGSNNVPTGCTATAMAIQMRFHEWPPSGSGLHSYSDTWGSVKFDHSVNFATRSYNWSAMPTNSLKLDNPDVADLMYDCGVAVDMNYETNGSSAWPSNYAMNTYFRYRGTTENNSTTPSDHLSGIAYSVRSGLPTVISSSAHTVLACGYRDTVTNYLYLNLGWNGANNGWYELTSIPGGDATIDRSYPYSAPGNFVFVDCDTVLPDFLQTGNLMTPYKTVSRGQANASAGGVLMVKAGSYTGSGNAPLTLSQPMTVRAYLGPATIGP